MQQPPSRNLLLGLGLLILAAGLVVLAPRLADPGVLGVDDFVEYWSAGRLNATGGDPYAPAELLPLQQAAGLKDDQPIMMWNPPWALTLVMPFGLPGYAAGRVAWLVLHLLLVVLCADVLWRYYGGPENRRAVAWVLALSFCPTLIVLRMGQIPPFILLGLVGFLYFQRDRRDSWAGATLALTAIKPHLVYLVGMAFVLWAVERRRWRALAGAVVAGVVLAAVPLLSNPAVFAQYRYATTHRPPVDWITTSFGTLLRICFAPDQSWLHFVPSAVGLVWFVPYWLRHRHTWDWGEQLPALLLASVISASFGWLGDQVVLLPALLPAAVWAMRCPQSRVRTAALAMYVTLNLLDLAINVGFHDQQLWHLWTAPALLLGYLSLRRYRAEENTPACCPLHEGAAYA